MKMILCGMLCLMLLSCASEPLKAPCDNHAYWCGAKTKINQW